MVATLNEKLRAKLLALAPKFEELSLLLYLIHRIEELDAVVEWLRGSHPQALAEKGGYIDWLRKDLGTREFSLGQSLPPRLVAHFPLVANKLSDLGKKLTLLRLAETCNVGIFDVAAQLEPILQAREVEGKKMYRVKAPHYTLPDKGLWLLGIMAYYTQMQPMKFRDVFLPGLTSSGQGEDIFFEWRPQEEWGEGGGW